jgi:hypothetical protein
MRVHVVHVAGRGAGLAEHSFVVKASWRFGKIVHLSNPVARGARNLLLRLTPESVARRQSEALYRLNY